MYTPPSRDRYISILTAVLGGTADIKSSKLLQAYATFSAMSAAATPTVEAYV